MSDTQAQSAGPSDALNREGAQWFARMRGPEAETLRPQFEAWLAQNAGQRTAYNRAAEIFAMGKLLAEEAPAPAPAPRRPAKARVTALAMCAFGAVAMGGWGMMQIMPRPGRAPQLVAANAGRTQTLATIAGETRAVRLADGSMLALGSDSAVAIELDSAGRRLRLLKGQARFEVAHERRPFVVLVGGGSVTARGTVFEVALMPAGRVDVRLLEGAIDVALPRRERKAPVVRQLRPGERIAFEVPAAAAPASHTPVAPAAVARDYQGITVAALVAEANRGAARPIRLADPALGAKRISGRFRIDDTALLAERLAVLFDGKVERGGAEIVLTR
jgi:transmembrane sensor